MKEKLKREEEDRFKNQNQIEKKIFSDFRIKEWNKEEDDCVQQYKKISIFSKDRGRHSPKERKKTLTIRLYIHDNNNRHNQRETLQKSIKENIPSSEQRK